jgi:hypothetical protein
MKKTWPSIDSSLDALSRETNQQPWDFVALASHLQSLAQLLVRAHPEQRRELIARFHDGAGKIPYPDDADIGALFLEDAGDKAQDSEQKKFLYQEAYFRASWCADSGTSGGECLARSKHLDRVNDKLRSA